MVMDTIQIRLAPELVRNVDNMVESGIYSSRSDVIRDAVRRFVWDNQVGTVKMKGGSVKVIRKARKELSKRPVNLREINEL